MAGAGTRLPAQRLRADRSADKVRQAMGMSAGARRVAEGFAATGGAVAAADAFEALVRTAAPARV